MRDFVIFILVLPLGVIQPAVQEGMEGFTNCLSQWAIFDQRRDVPSAFLTDQTLVEEICSTGKSVDSMDQCVRRFTDPYYTNVFVYWNGIRDKYNIICKYYTDFIRFEPCRVNRNVVKAYDECPKRFPKPTCSEFKKKIECVKDALRQNCKGKQVTYFSNLIDTELSPLLDYIRCTMDPEPAILPTYTKYHKPTHTTTTTTTSTTTATTTTTTTPKTQSISASKQEYVVREVTVDIGENLNLEEEDLYSGSLRPSTATTCLITVGVFLYLNSVFVLRLFWGHR